MKPDKKTPKAFKQACQQIELLLFDCDGVLTDGRIILGSNGFEAKCFSTTDGMALKMWKSAGFKAGAITGRSSDALIKRAEELKFDELHQGIAKKGRTLEKILTERQLKAEQVAYIGDDVNDLPVGTRVGLFFVPANHHPSIRPYADFVLNSSGGHGVIRETVDILLEHKNMMEKLIAGFLDDK
ncbi:MAG: KdsC family phosphatase [Candidatus Rifleibacteriota bacterium]